MHAFLDAASTTCQSAIMPQNAEDDDLPPLEETVDEGSRMEEVD